ncbi:MAG: OapC/ArvC family zinc-ribbon domain-containing protein [Candidatus Heimdallarchaeaceae archaeon]
MEKEKKRTICAVCKKELQLTKDIIIHGCPYCGSFKFRTSRELPPDEEKQHELELIVEKELKEIEIEDSLEAIRLTDEGIFEVDIEKLLSKTSDKQPIIARDKDGSYFIKFQEKKDKNDEK